ncbi:MAG: hypothetical protein R2761_04895 [Acidimicrobiales bacterium]
MTARRAEGGTVTTHLDDRSNPGDGAEAERAGSGDASDGPTTQPAGDETVPTTAPTMAATAEPDGWDQPPAAPLRTPMPTQSALSRLGDLLVSPFGRHRRETMVLLSLVILAVLVWVAVSELLVAPGASQSILS